MIIGTRQRFTGVSILGGSVNNRVGLIQQTLGALYVVGKIWGASAATTPGGAAVRICWDGTNSAASITSPGTPASSVGTGLYITGTGAVALNVTEPNGIPVFMFFTPVALVSTLAGMSPMIPIPYPTIDYRMVGNAAASPGGDFTVNADFWVVYADARASAIEGISRGNASGDTLPFIPLPT